MNGLSTELVHEGGCLCGSIRYKTRGEPRRGQVCHCTFCQKFTGSAFLVEAIFPKENVEIIGSTFGTYSHTSDESGKSLHLNFCLKCGSHFGLKADRFPEIYIICGGTFDDPNWFKISTHIFVRSAVHWMVLPEDVNTFQKHHTPA
jgi:hypothetical protein